MPACPVCETDNPQAAVECAGCGRVLRRATEVPGFAPPIEGLEPTLHGEAAARVDPLPELESTAVAPRGLRVQQERLEIERTPHDLGGSDQTNWVPGPLEIERGRDEDAEPRTSPPTDSGACPWCGAASTAAICDSCGRHRARYFAPPIPPPDGAAATEAVLCPACFARVASGPRCAECGVPLPVREP